jgi:hypothetical protein
MATKSEIRSDVRAARKGETVYRADSMLVRVGDVYEMIATRNGQFHRHTLNAAATDANRLAAHWEGFLPA